MSSVPLTQLEFLSPQLSELDPFSPHLKMVSLGGIKVFEGGWTAGELLKRTAQLAASHSHFVRVHDTFTQMHAQLDQLNFSWTSSLIGLCEAQFGIALIDARHDQSWINQSVDRICEEFRIWSETRERAQLNRPLYLWVWIEVPERDIVPIQSDHSDSLVTIERMLSQHGAHLLGVDHGSALSIDLDGVRLWSQLTRWLDFVSSQISEEERSLPRECIDAFTFVPAGSYYQGTSQLAAADERPPHRVKLTNSFWVSQTPITSSLWTHLMPELSLAPDQGSNFPITEMTWFNALRFCNRLSQLEQLSPAYHIEEHILPEVTWNPMADGYRLLTEAEWEYACRSGVGRTPHARSSPLPPAWTAQRAGLSTHPVGQLLPNLWGLYDCLGNVSEWCQDIYQKECYQKRAQNRISINPCEHHAQASDRVIRGGAFDTEPFLATPTKRDSCSPDQAWSSIGFRITRPSVT